MIICNKKEAFLPFSIFITFTQLKQKQNENKIENGKYI
jgi:hypothetical protein